jgi:serine/threonine-protein kinase
VHGENSEEGNAEDSSRFSLRERTESRIGETASGRWTLLSVLGVGGTAAVYSARHNNGRLVAIKILHADLARDAGSRRRFLREAYAANRVRHPGAVQVLDDGEMMDGTPFLVLELLTGKSLSEFMHPGSRLDPVEVIAIGAAILDVLAAAHDAGVIHRDVKPSNVFVTADRGVKVLDFGIAKLRDHAADDSTLTRGDTALGTPSFMSPEQAAGRSELDARSDLWSVGATLFALLAGRTVHTGSTAREVLVTTATARASSIASLVKGLPSNVVLAIDRALEFDRNKRWSNARAMRAALVGTAADYSPGPTTAPQQPTIRRRPWAATSASAILLIVIAALFWSRRERFGASQKVNPPRASAATESPTPRSTGLAGAVERSSQVANPQLAPAPAGSNAVGIALSGAGSGPIERRSQHARDARLHPTAPAASALPQATSAADSTAIAAPASTADQHTLLERRH